MSDNVLSEKEIKEEILSLYKNDLESVLLMYGVKVVKGKIVSRRSGLKLNVKFEHSVGFFEIELPLIDKELFCTLNNSLYSFAYIPINLNDFIDGKTDELKLAHPYRFVLSEAIKSVGDKIYSSDVFTAMVRKAKGGTIKTLQDNIRKTMNNVKEYSWSERDNCPVMWLDNYKSDLGKELLANNIQLGFSYQELLSALGIRGVDLNTGSTSAPGKRCKVAKNWYIKRGNGTFTLVRKETATNSCFDITNSLKGELYPCFIKTSAKRDNTATIKDTYNLVKPSGYVRKFKVI